MNYKIVSDSSCDIINTGNEAFETVAMKIFTDEKEYIDNESLDLTVMLDELKRYKGRSYTGCPNISEWLNAFGDADNVFAVTITGGLSGSYSSALAAKKIAEKENENRNIFVIDTLSAGPEIRLIIEKLSLLIQEKNSFEEIVGKITSYKEHTHLLFALESMHNFVQNGRVSKMAALAAGTLGIRVLGTASSKGTLEMCSKHRGAAKTIQAILPQMLRRGYCGGKVRIGHTKNEEGAKMLAELISGSYPNADINIYHMRGLCSYYAEEGGILVGFEG